MTQRGNAGREEGKRGEEEEAGGKEVAVGNEDEEFEKGELSEENEEGDEEGEVAMEERQAQLSGLAVGCRYFIPADCFPEQKPQQLPPHGQGWLATVRACYRNRVIYHCDGDPVKDLATCSMDEFVKDCKPLGTRLQLGDILFGLRYQSDLRVQSKVEHLNLCLLLSALRSDISVFRCIALHLCDF